jgi:hypothetical protein
METSPFVSCYYMKEAVLNTWTGEFWGYRIAGNFTQVAVGQRVYIPSMNMHRRTRRGRRQTRRIRNDMDESEAGGPTRQCLYCLAFGHRMRYCPKVREDTETAGGAGHEEPSTAPARPSTSAGRRRRGRSHGQTDQGQGSAI